MKKSPYTLFPPENEFSPFVKKHGAFGINRPQQKARSNERALF